MMAESPQENLLKGTVTFPDKLIDSAIKDHLKKKGVKINAAALKLLSEVLRMVTLEAAARSALEAKNEAESQVQLQHLEKILAQLLLDL